MGRGIRQIREASTEYLFRTAAAAAKYAADSSDTCVYSDIQVSLARDFMKVLGPQNFKFMRTYDHLQEPTHQGHTPLMDSSLILI